MPRRQLLYAEGDELVHLYFVQAGRVKTSKTTAEGKEFSTGFYQAGEFVGHQVLLEHAPYHDTATVVEDAVLYYIPVEEFTDLLLRNVEVSQ